MKVFYHRLHRIVFNFKMKITNKPDIYKVIMKLVFIIGYTVA